MPWLSVRMWSSSNKFNFTYIGALCMNCRLQPSVRQKESNRFDQVMREQTRHRLCQTTLVDRNCRLNHCLTQLRWILCGSFNWILSGVCRKVKATACNSCIEASTALIERHVHSQVRDVGSRYWRRFPLPRYHFHGRYNPAELPPIPLADPLQEPPRPPSPEPTIATFSRDASQNHNDLSCQWSTIDIRLVGSHPLWGHYLWVSFRCAIFVRGGPETHISDFYQDGMLQRHSPTSLMSTLISTKGVPSSNWEQVADFQES